MTGYSPFRFDDGSTMFYAIAMITLYLISKLTSPTLRIFNIKHRMVITMTHHLVSWVNWDIPSICTVVTSLSKDILFVVY